MERESELVIPIVIDRITGETIGKNDENEILQDEDDADKKQPIAIDRLRPSDD
ncbi:hypothetical protein GYA49_02765 [Candidatus Beckwithbacteria bacterium]|nr:hypothetical protein [Candidatus Beckwithbacteria bacterium]